MQGSFKNTETLMNEHSPNVALPIIQHNKLYKLHKLILKRTKLKIYWENLLYKGRRMLDW